MKIFLCLLFLSPIASANFEVELGHGNAFVKGDTITSLMLKGGYLMEVLPLGPGVVSVGGGLRITQYSGDEFQAGSSDDKHLEDISIMAQNIYGQVHYDYESWRLGFNIDFFGSTSGSSATIKDTNTKIDPVSGNRLNGGKSDIGTLNSELFIGYRWDKWLANFGTSHAVIEYEDDGLSGDERRQRFIDSYFVNVGYIF